MARQFFNGSQIITEVADPLLWDKINSKMAKDSGVYIVFSKQNGLYEQVSRVLSIDPNGTLYIGKANSFKERVIGLKKSIIYKSNAHDFGIRYYRNIQFQNKFPVESLYVALLQSDTPFETEQQLLKEYLNDFGELPPFNFI
jgi:hypothetical protein